MGNITLEYSVRQNCFHISDLETVCKDNMLGLSSGRPSDYLLIGIFESYEEADAECKRLTNNGFRSKASRFKSHSMRLADVPSL